MAANGNGLLKPIVQVGALGLVGLMLVGLFLLIREFTPAIISRLERTAVAIETVAASTREAEDERKEQTDVLKEIASGQSQVLDIITTDPEDRERVRIRIRSEREP